MKDYVEIIFNPTQKNIDEINKWSNEKSALYSSFKSKTLIIAKYMGVAVGFCSFEIAGITLHIHSSEVKKDFKLNGIGRRMNEELERKFKDKYFTVVASCPDFICGPAGVVKIVNGEILDSYGFAGERQKILENPDPELIFQWFGKGGFEEEYRNLHADQHPKKWIEELYAQNLIEFSPEQENELLEYIKLTTLGQVEWQEIKIS